jgi:hypothetical protein
VKKSGDLCSNKSSQLAIWASSKCAAATIENDEFTNNYMGLSVLQKAEKKTSKNTRDSKATLPWADGSMLIPFRWKFPEMGVPLDIPFDHLF